MGSARVGQRDGGSAEPRHDAAHQHAVERVGVAQYVEQGRASGLIPEGAGSAHPQQGERDADQRGDGQGRVPWTAAGRQVERIGCAGTLDPVQAGKNRRPHADAHQPDDLGRGAEPAAPGVGEHEGGGDGNQADHSHDL